MGEQIHRRGSRPVPGPDDDAGSERFFAKDVLLIAEPNVRRKGRQAVADRLREPLDMESVVRRLIALLSEQGQA